MKDYKEFWVWWKGRTLTSITIPKNGIYVIEYDAYEGLLKKNEVLKNKYRLALAELRVSKWIGEIKWKLK